MNFSAITDVLSDHPYATAGAVVLGLYLFTRGGGAPAAVSDQSASLASLQIASDTNVQLAGIQAQRDAVALQSSRDITLASIGYATADRQASVMTAVSAMDANKSTAETYTNAALQSFQSALGFTAAKKDLENQRAQLDITSQLGYADIMSNKETTLAGIASNNYLGSLSINSARDLGISQISADLDLSKYMLPFSERINQSNNNAMTQLSHDQIKIAKIGASNSLFNNLISNGFGLASQGLSMQGGH